MIYYFGGVNGVGKTTLIEEITKQDKSFTHLKGSQLLMRSIGIAEGDYSALRSLPADYKNDKFGEILKEIKLKHESSSENLIIDAHFLNIISGKRYKVTDDWISVVDGLVLIESQPELILKRILRDSSRNREMFEGEIRIEDLIEYINDYKSEFKSIAHKYKIPTITIMNEENNIESGVKSFLEFHKAKS